MSESNSTFIYTSLVDKINENIEQNELREMILEFINFQSKKGFPFGELLILHYQMYNGKKTNEIYDIAAAVELLILSFDILDDFEDDDSHDKPWIMDTPYSLNATTAMQYLSSTIIQKSSFDNKEKALYLYSKFALKSVHGQHKDILNICRSEEEYISMSIEKSGSLTALACSIGVILATGDCPEEIETFGKYIGLIGQINNDINDIKAWNSKNDLLNKKYSLPIIYFLNSQDEKAPIVQNYYDNKIPKEELMKHKESLRKKIIETGAIIYSEVIKKVYQNKAMSQLLSLKIDQFYIDQFLKYID